MKISLISLILFSVASSTSASAILENYSDGMKGNLDSARLACTATIEQVANDSKFFQTDLTLKQAIDICKKPTVSKKSEDWLRLGDFYWSFFRKFQEVGSKYLKDMAVAYEKGLSLGIKDSDRYFRMIWARSLKKGKFKPNLYIIESADFKTLDKALKKGIAEGYKGLWAYYADENEQEDLMLMAQFMESSAKFKDRDFIDKAFSNLIEIDDLRGLARLYHAVNITIRYGESYKDSQEAISTWMPKLVELSDKSAELALALGYAQESNNKRIHFYAKALKGLPDNLKETYFGWFIEAIQTACKEKDEEGLREILNAFGRYYTSAYSTHLDTKIWDGIKDPLWTKKIGEEVLLPLIGKTQGGWAEFLLSTLYYRVEGEKSENKAIDLLLKATTAGNGATLGNCVVHMYNRGQLKQIQELIAEYDKHQSLTLRFLVRAYLVSVEKDENKQRELYSDLMKSFPVSMEARLYVIRQIFKQLDKKPSDEFMNWMESELDAGYDKSKGHIGVSAKGVLWLAKCRHFSSEEYPYITTNFRLATKWYQRAIDLYDVDIYRKLSVIQFGLGMLYENGDASLPRDEKVAADWYQKVLSDKEQEFYHLHAIYSLVGFRNTYAEVSKLARFADTLDEPKTDEDKIRLAYIHYRAGTTAYSEAKYKEAFRWYEKDKRNPFAYYATLNDLAIFYDIGLPNVVKKDEKFATNLLTRALCKSNRNPFNYRRLAERYEQGIGVKKNAIYAYHLFYHANDDKYKTRMNKLKEQLTQKEYESAISQDLTKEICEKVN